MTSSASSPLETPQSGTLDATTNPQPPPPPPASDAKDQHPGDSERTDPPSAGEGAAAAGGDPERSGGEGANDQEEEEEELECGFCLFMKGGGCKDEFIAWENCVEEAQKTGEDVVDKCFEITSLLKKCMDAHADYYEPILRAEKAMAEAVEAPESEE